MVGAAARVDRDGLLTADEILQAASRSRRARRRARRRRGRDGAWVCWWCWEPARALAPGWPVPGRAAAPCGWGPARRPGASTASKARRAAQAEPAGGGALASAGRAPGAGGSACAPRSAIWKMRPTFAGRRGPGRPRRGRRRRSGAAGARRRGRTARGRAGATPSARWRAACRRRRARGAGRRTRRAGSGARGRRPAACHLPGRPRRGPRRAGTGRRPDRPRSPWWAARAAGWVRQRGSRGRHVDGYGAELAAIASVGQRGDHPQRQRGDREHGDGGERETAVRHGRDLRRVWGSSSGEGCSEGLIGRSARLRRSSGARPRCR